ncbi:hypothetical protein AYO42_05845 [Rhizomicrobium sp. SCGC AG-212-E05]|nr:hypothetical protein AYO42_05845 [Rhizomicrobium sp. SCGC AG-212-E05]
MAVYRFRYADASGAAIRTTIMQCGDDAEAIGKAEDTMKDRYVTLEVFEGERLVHGAHYVSRTQHRDQASQAAQF